MKKLYSLFLAAILTGSSLLVPGTALAGGPHASITPKFWSSVENFNAFDNAHISDSATGTQAVIREQVNIPLVGMSISLTPNEDVPLDILMNMYGGSTKGDFTHVIRHGTTLGTTAYGEYTAKRVDVEFLLRFRPKQAMWNLFGGLRVNSFEDTLKFKTARGTWSSVIFTATGNDTLKRQTNIVLMELGAGFFTPANRAGTVRFFGNTTFGVGSFQSWIKNGLTKTDRKKTQGGAIGWDVNTGIEVMFTRNLAMNARYRMYAKPTSPLKDRYDFTVIHGPDLGLTFRF